MAKADNLDWKTYESITKYIYETLGQRSGVKVVGYGNTCKKKGKSGVHHQIDVLTAHTDGLHTYETAIECKYWKDKVNKDVVMKVCSIINDTTITKGIIVSKGGFTPDGIEFARYNNIALVELREFEESDLHNTSGQIDIGILNLNIKIHRTRPEILNIEIGDGRKIEIKHEFDYFAYIISLENGNQIPLYDLVNDFRKKVNHKNDKANPMIGKYIIPGSKLFNKQSNETNNLDEIMFTGQLTESDENRILQFNIVDKVWLIMKSIFEEKTFSFSEGGVILEHKKYNSGDKTHLNI